MRSLPTKLQELLTLRTGLQLICEGKLSMGSKYALQKLEARSIEPHK